MFAGRYFAPRYFPRRYFPEVGAVLPVPSAPTVTVHVGGGHHRPRPRREIPEWLVRLFNAPPRPWQDPVAVIEDEEIDAEMVRLLQEQALSAYGVVSLAWKELTEWPAIAEKDIADLKRAIEQKGLWNGLHKQLMTNMQPLFLRAVLIGAELGRTQKPARERRKRAAKLLRGYRAGEAATALDAEAAWLTTTAETYVSSYMDTWWAGLRQTAADALRQSILTAIAKGTGAPGVIKDIDSIFGKQRAEMIAVTEVTRLMGHGAQLQYTRVGFTEWEWRTANDRRVDPICAAKAAGGPYPMSTAFDPAHPRCRCWPVPSGKAEPKKGK